MVWLVYDNRPATSNLVNRNTHEDIEHKHVKRKVVEPSRKESVQLCTGDCYTIVRRWFHCVGDWRIIACLSDKCQIELSPSKRYNSNEIRLDSYKTREKAHKIVPILFTLISLLGWKTVLKYSISNRSFRLIFLKQYHLCEWLTLQKDSA